jgi:hypothetical protein
LPKEVKAVDEFDLSKLPEKFEPILKYVAKWGVSDDADRGEILNHSSTPVLKDLAEVVDRWMKDIVGYLDECGADLTEETSAMDGLAQAGMEAEIVLKEREGLESAG